MNLKAINYEVDQGLTNNQYKENTMLKAYRGGECGEGGEGGEGGVY